MIDRSKVIDALVAADIGPAAKEEASRLVEHYLDKLETFPEMEWKVVAVEVPFYIQLEPKTYIIGQMDTIFNAGDEASGDIFVQAEWKTRRAPKLKRDGTNYEGDDEDGWLAEISNGPQLGVYALAGREGKFILPEPIPVLDAPGAPVRMTNHVRFHSPEPRIFVRAAIKSSPPDVWPHDSNKGLFTFPGPMLDVVHAALLSEAASIRARRKLGVVPYQLPGLQCTNMYRRTCGYLESVCKPHKTPPLEPVGWHHPDSRTPDPGYDICDILGLDPHDPELVVLSQSALQSHYQCAEKGRIDYGGYFLGQEESFELDTGTGYHAGLGAIYRLLDNPNRVK